MTPSSRLRRRLAALAGALLGVAVAVALIGWLEVQLSPGVRVVLALGAAGLGAMFGPAALLPIWDRATVGVAGGRSAPARPLAPDCECMEPRLWGSERGGRSLGVDRTRGRFGDVWLDTCTLCGRIWLFYRVEYEAFTASGRWYRAVISPEVAAAVRPKTAAVELARSDYRVKGGSYFDSTGRIEHGPGRVSVGLDHGVGPEDGPGALE